MHPVGDPAQPPERERAFRRRLVETALKALRTPLEKQTIFGLE